MEKIDCPMIEGVLLQPRKKIVDERGMIMHMMREDDPHFHRFGEIYFSIINPGVVKAWHIHSKMELNYACIHGMIKLVLYDGRKDSPTNGVFNEFFIGEDDYMLVSIPKMIWNGFKGISVYPSIVANCSTFPHSPEEIMRDNPHNPAIVSSYDWSRKDG